jgi:hypothetical protein
MVKIRKLGMIGRKNQHQNNVADHSRKEIIKNHNMK